MHLSDLGPPSALWRRWSLLAAGHVALGSSCAEIRRSDGCAHLGSADGAWLRMRRMVGDRAVLWGHHDELPFDARFTDELHDAAPDWAWEPDTAHALRGIGFLAWHAHGQWWSVPSPVPDQVAAMLDPITCEESLRTWWSRSCPHAEGDQITAVLQTPDAAHLAVVSGPRSAARAARQIELGRGWAAHISDTATGHLRAQVHAQMRLAGELGDRGHPPRPPLLRQWARVHAGTAAFRHAVSGLGTGRTPALVPAGTNNGLTPAQARALDNVLLELRMEETDPASGAWLFARVVTEGRSVRMERAYDSWPLWFETARGPAMVALHEEMSERSRAWRPAWSALLPSDRF